jgi:hypothetical protein
VTSWMESSRMSCRIFMFAYVDELALVISDAWAPLGPLASVFFVGGDGSAASRESS